MDNPWKCPACGVWNAPGVTAHRCEDGSCLGGGAIIVTLPPVPPGFWRCSTCGSNVPFGMGHGCGVQIPMQPWPPVALMVNGTGSPDTLIASAFVVG